MDSEKLKEIRRNLSMLPLLKERAEKLNNKIKDKEQKVHSLLQKYEKESLDIERLKKDSLSATLLKFIGRYEGKFDKEFQEMLAAKIEYDKACDRVKELYREHSEIMDRISILKIEQYAYEDELKRREQMLLSRMNDKLSIRYRQLETEREMLTRQLVEMDEALRAAYRVKNTAQNAMEHLDSAENWATYDVWFKGGIFSHMAKYDHIDKAESDFNILSSQIKDLQKELADIDIVNIPEVAGIDSVTRAMDFWFDNIFTDLSVRSQIYENMEQIRALYGKIDAIILNIERNKNKINKMLSDIECKKDELIISL